MLNAKKYLHQGESPYPHIGNLIEKKLKEKRITVTEAARRIGVTRPVFQDYLSQVSVQVGILWRIGIALEYNFFADLMSALPEEVLQNNDSIFQETIKNQQQEILDLKKELSTYKSILTRNI